MKMRMNAGLGSIAALGLVLALGLAGSAPAEEPASITKQVHGMQVQALQQDMLNNPDLFALVLALQESGAVQDILSDPDLMAKINSGDLSALQGDPKIERLSNDPIVKGMAQDLER